MAEVLPIDGFITLDNIINNFIISYTGPGKLIPDAKRTEVIFHARRCLQEFAYETLKSQMSDVSTLPVAVGGVTKYTMPSDSVIVIGILRSTTSGGATQTQAMTRTPDVIPLDQLTYYVDYTNRTVSFIGTLANYTISFSYLSNALTNDESALIPKLAEEALYSCMIYAVLANRENTDPNVLQRLLIEKIDKLERSKSRLIFTNFT